MVATKLPAPIAVYLEMGRQRVFACALDWPGWCRAGRTEAQALEGLAAYGHRYAVVARQAGILFVPGDALQVVERLTGPVGMTDFGVPGAVAGSDRQPWLAEVARRQLELLKAAWVVFDQVAAVTSAQLRKGPRGGGRDRDELIDHVLRAEAAYARKLGVRQPPPARDAPDAIAASREALIAALRAAAAPEQGLDARWPPRYAVRRIAWHVLDHAWEMEDRRLPDQ